ncbi:MAG: DUF1592 domain-containing protein [Nannocystis sp.]|nr:DUF1592 domain-containing protein [Nannocystis sp.]
MVASLARTPKRPLCLAAVLLAGCYTPGGGEDSATDTAPTSTLTDPGTTTKGGGDAGESETDTDTGGEQAQDPGRVTLHRLNRVEYNNTVRDLLWTTKTPADDFPADDVSLGLDNIADVLSLSPLQVELYERAAEALIEEAMQVAVLEPTVWKREAEGPDVTPSLGAAAGEFWNLWSNGTVTTTITIADPGEYRFESRLYGQQAGDALPHAILHIDGKAVASYDVDAINTGPKIYAVDLTLAAGAHTFAVEFTNDFYDPDNMKDRNLLVDWLQVSGPLDAAGEPNKQRERIMICDPQQIGEEACARQIFERFGRRALRRPLSEGELDRLLLLFAEAKMNGEGFDDGIKLGLRALLTSPHFIFRVELDPAPQDLTPHPLSDFELATRLSYFLWSSMPDDELLDLAASGELSAPGVLEGQALRLLADPRASALVDNFAGQWFLIRAIQDAFHDEQVFPTWTPELRAAMAEEMRLFTGTFFAGDRDMIELLTAKQTFVNGALAAHYGIDGVQGEGFVEADLSGVPRQGILTQAGLLSVLAHADHTSVVKRGKWLMQSVLCMTPPPPPDGLEIPPLPDPPPGATQREIFELHRADPICASCHVIMDPLGFSLEHYDAIGAYRLFDNGGDVDASGNLPSGATFNNALEMADLLADEPDFAQCMVQKTFIYALGRNLSPVDPPYLDEIITQFEKGDRHFTALVLALVTSDAFRMRRGDPS